MICYSCNHIVGVKWVKVCPLCGNDQIEAQNLEARAKIERNLPSIDDAATERS